MWFPDWTKLIDLSNRGVIRSIDKVKEICDVSTPDELALVYVNDMNPAFL